MNIEDLVDKYVRLRDKIKVLNDDHKAKMVPFNEALDTLNGILLSHLTTIGAETAGTKAGTVYRTMKKSATLADGEAFRRYVVETASWDLADWKANAVAVADFIEKNEGAIPPGVNYTTRYEVGVRRK
jgi:hypothetical protein